MVIAVRRPLRQPLPQASFGPFSVLEVLPWLVLATAMQVIACGGRPVAVLAIASAGIADSHAFAEVAQRSIEPATARLPPALQRLKEISPARRKVNQC